MLKITTASGSTYLVDEELMRFQRIKASDDSVESRSYFFMARPNKGVPMVIFLDDPNSNPNAHMWISTIVETIEGES